MLKPTNDEMHEALAEAERMRDQGADPHHISKSLQYLDHHVRRLEAVFRAAKNYIHFGQEEREHAILANAIDAARSENLHETEQEEEVLGL